jgi:uncharacterized membrane protein
MKQQGKQAQAWGVPAKSEPRWPASLAIVVCALLNFVLPGKFTMGPVWLVPAMEAAILLPLSIAAPRRVAHESKWSQIAAVALIALANLANVVSLVLLVRELVFNGKNITGPELLYSSVAIWLTNVIVFALWYWELDRGGPDDRLRSEHGAPDFLFPQMSTPGCTAGNWTPGFIDYVYVAFTNATAFSPTDTMPLSPWAKILMLLQALASLITIAIVAARAVNILS